MILGLRSVREAKPGDKWKELFNKLWPFYKHWFLGEGHTARPGYLTSSTALKNYMPELSGIYDELVELAGGGDVEARFLSLYCPPPYMSGCSQIAWTRDSKSLIRNYDYSPKYFDGLLVSTDWLQPVMGMSDCLWGLLDGMNASGLAASLTFGGKREVGHGFGIPLLVRYILETCTNVAEGIAVCFRVPVHMAYNITLIDKGGNYASVFLHPGREPNVSYEASCTNHQELVEWTEYAWFSQTVERKQFLDYCLMDPAETRDSMIRKFFKPPLYHTRFEKSFGTLYTVSYEVDKGEMHVLWPERKTVKSFDKFKEDRLIINLGKTVQDKLTL